jgi:hypothetical protein
MIYKEKRIYVNHFDLGRKAMLITLIGIAAGAVVGFLYFRLVGCRSGSCPLTSNPVRSVLYWALIGGLAASGFGR